MKSTFMRQIQRSLDLLFPVCCVECGDVLDTSKNNGAFCSKCRPDYFHDSPSVCPICSGFVPDDMLIGRSSCYCCSKPGKPLSGIVTLTRYHENQKIGKMILKMKHGGQTWYAREFGTQLAAKIRKTVPGVSWDAVVSVPLHITRRWKRGYNQAGLISGFLAGELGITAYDWLLRRCRRTQPQSGGRSERKQNVEGAFRSGGFCSNANIILVDDVVTTGATIRESAEILFQAGAASVIVAAVAWVPMGYPAEQRQQVNSGDNNERER